MVKISEEQPDEEDNHTFGVARGLVSERAANQRLDTLQKEQSKRSKEEKTLISKYNVDAQQKERLQRIRKDDNAATTSTILQNNTRLNDYQKRALQKRLRVSQNHSNKAVRSKLYTYKTKRYEAAVAAADAQVVLHTEQAGFLESEHDLEFTTRLKQIDLKRKYLDENTARHVFDLKLDQFGPYGCKYDRSGRYSVLYGQRGHLSIMDSHHLSLHHEFHVKERIRDACFLHNFSMLAVAQFSHVYIYDDQGAEVHKLQDHVDPMALEFLPYHWLLASVGRLGRLTYQDTSTGEVVCAHRTKLGPCSVMRQNPSNAVMHLGHTNGTVTLWSPSSTQYLAKLQCHKGAPITSLAIDLSGHTMVTGGADRQVKIWDLRKLQCTHAYFCDPGTPSSLDISQRNVLGVGHAGHATFWSPKALQTKVKLPYMHHALPSCTVETLRFRPFEDVCAIGHSLGMASTVIPGSGEPNLDTTEYNLNPFQDKKQRREAEVRALLDKLDPNMITLDPNDIGGMEESTPEVRNERLQDLQEEADSRKKAKKEKKKKRGRSKIQTQLRRKQANVVDHQVLKLREAREREKEEAVNTKAVKSIKSSSLQQEHLAQNAPPALKRFFKISSTDVEQNPAPSSSSQPPAKRKKTKGGQNKMAVIPVAATTVLLILSVLASLLPLCSSTKDDAVPSFLFDVIETENVPTFLFDENSQENDGYELSSNVVGGSCASLTTCENCTNTYTCHWCEKTESCHARGSFYGCAWGNVCHKSDVKPKENSTCANHASCSECALASHFCHWCEHDNSCHAVGSPYGCAVGVDCYSNDRCRRKESEPLPGGYFLADIPMFSLIVISTFACILIGCLTCCHYVTTNVKGAYDDLATITMAASRAPVSLIGGNNGHFYSTLEPHPEEDEQLMDSEPAEDPVPREFEIVGTGTAKFVHDEEANQLTTDNLQTPPTTGSELEQNPYVLVNDIPGTGVGVSFQESRPLLHPSFNGSIAGTLEESGHMKRLYRCCTIIYVLCVVMLVALVGASIFFYPKQPQYSVCNDAVAWKRIMTNIAALKFDASFEILLSLSNPNHIGAVLESGKGSYSFEGKQIGTFEIPPVSVDAMAVSDLMLIARVSPDRQQALELIEAYYLGKLILEAEFEGTVRVPALFGIQFDIQLTNIEVDVTALSDRSLCHCPTWADHNKTVEWQLMSGNTPN